MLPLPCRLLSWEVGATLASFPAPHPSVSCLSFRRREEALGDGGDCVLPILNKCLLFLPLSCVLSIGYEVAFVGLDTREPQSASASALTAPALHLPAVLAAAGLGGRGGVSAGIWARIS